MPRRTKPWPVDMPDTLVISGGGTRGIVALGAIHALRQHGFLDNVTNFVGTSAGAYMAAVCATKQSCIDILERMQRNPFKGSVNIASLETCFGLDNGTSLQQWVDSTLGIHGSFRDVLETHGMNLVVCVTNVTSKCPTYWSMRTSESLDIGFAVRVSCSVPLIFGAVSYGTNLYTDGCVCDNVPWRYAVDTLGSKRVLLIVFESTENTESGKGPSSLEAYVSMLMEATMINVPSATSPESSIVTVFRIQVSHSGLDFEIPPSQMANLFTNGYRQGLLFVKKNV
jgi:predicted acylesterase/phospholipase RssA